MKQRGRKETAVAEMITTGIQDQTNGSLGTAFSLTIITSFLHLLLTHSVNTMWNPAFPRKGTFKAFLLPQCLYLELRQKIRKTYMYYLFLWLCCVCRWHLCFFPSTSATIIVHRSHHIQNIQNNVCTKYKICKKESTVSKHPNHGDKNQTSNSGGKRHT